MINKIKIKNFKTFKLLDITCSNLNILTGLNGSGKSSLLQALLLLRQSYRVGIQENLGLVLQEGQLISLGSGKDVYYHGGKNEDIEFNIDDDQKVFNWSFEYKPNNDILKMRREGTLAGLSVLSLFNDKFQYLSSDRILPQEVYPRSEYQVRNKNNLGKHGEFSAHYLSEFGASQEIVDVSLQHPSASSKSLLHNTEAWVSEISPGLKLISNSLGGVDVVKMVVRYETQTGFTNETKLINTGTGISYILPIVLSILKSKPGDLLIVENPELHVHPRGQAVIGKMLALTASLGVQIFVETHSDHVLNGVRVAVMENNIAREDATFFYFERVSSEFEQSTCVSQISIDAKGQFSEMPSGFMDEWTIQLLKLI